MHKRFQVTTINGPHYQTTVPAFIRRALGLHRGSALAWVLQEDGTITVHPVTMERVPHDSAEGSSDEHAMG